MLVSYPNGAIAAVVDRGTGIAAAGSIIDAKGRTVAVLSHDTSQGAVMRVMDPAHGTVVDTVVQGQLSEQQRVTPYQWTHMGLQLQFLPASWEVRALLSYSIFNGLIYVFIQVVARVDIKKYKFQCSSINGISLFSEQTSAATGKKKQTTPKRIHLESPAKVSPHSPMVITGGPLHHTEDTGVDHEHIREGINSLLSKLDGLLSDMKNTTYDA